MRFWMRWVKPVVWPPMNARKSSTIARCSSALTRPTHGAAHLPMSPSRHGRPTALARRNTPALHERMGNTRSSGVDGVADGPGMAVRAEVAHTLALRAAHDHDARKLLATRDGQPGIGLVVAVLDVEPRVELLDPRVLELERLDLGVDDRPVDADARGDHLLGARVQAGDVLEVGAQARRAGTWPCRRR